VGYGNALRTGDGHLQARGSFMLADPAEVESTVVVCETVIT